MLPFTSRLAGKKKLVPAMRSSSSRTAAANSTAKLNKLRIAVMNHAQQVSGSRMSDMPGQRISMNVTMKLIEPSTEATQKRAMDTIQRFCPVPSPGPASFPTALKGA